VEKRKKYQAIVVGTSAGGFHAVSVILGTLPTDFPVPVIVVQHRAKESQDLFEEVLQRKRTITIRQADEKEHIKTGNVYVAPPNYHLLIEMDRTFSLSLEPPVQYSRPSIDVLFETAAFTYRDKLIGIILTGSNSDGAAGISAIRKMGGLTIAQDPAEAQYAHMTQASIDTKHVQHVWRLKEIGEFLQSLARG
jgi:two-component system chemotaxis response regulator CheB